MHALQISDEFTFLTDLSYHLSNRYQRPVSSIVVTLQHGTCMLFAGTFEPAYVMAVFALPSQVQTTVNKRNAVLIQKHMEESIGVAPSRGYVRFVAVPEENAAWHGKTVAGEIAELAGDGAEDGQSISSKKSRVRSRLSMKVGYAERSLLFNRL
jgi:Macrophage migration inhibitory factor (MIF)